MIFDEDDQLKDATTNLNIVLNIQKIELHNVAYSRVAISVRTE